MSKSSKSEGVAQPAGHLNHYRPMLDGVVFFLALLGVLVVVHLWIQSGRGFDRGCFGFTAPAEVTTAVDCEAVTESDAGTLLGVSNVVLGLAFYLGLVGISFKVTSASVRTITTWKRLRALAIVVGFCYSLYLVYVQYFQLGQFCRLCLISASIVAVLFLLVAADYLTSGKADGGGPFRPTKFFAGLTLVTAVIAVGDVLYFRNLPESQIEPGQTAEILQGADGVGECIYDPEKPVVENYVDMASFSDPSRGSPGAPVTIIEFFDPNCPHCATLHPVMDAVVDRYGDKAWVVWRPFVLWQFSIPQVEALYIAGQEGKFFEMLEEQFARQRQGGIPIDELVEIAHSIGMDG
ncbi:MAG: vitamin K epoxide reductase family protein, partial [Rhodothermales bacterium]|nr:vitamin K epoxide reductase family protein [Rhodothermales bacterium]